MARKKTEATRMNIKAQISGRLREVRQEIFGDHGGPDLARRLNLPARTWYNYESGVTVPAEVLLSFIEHTGANPKWLLTGEGPRFRHECDDVSLDELSPSDLIRRSLTQLGKNSATPEPGELEEFVKIAVVPFEGLLGEGDGTSIGQVLVDRVWIANPEATVAASIEDDSMSPILPIGSLIAVDRSLRDYEGVVGRIVVAQVAGKTLVRWFEAMDNHRILRSNRPAQHPLIVLEPRESKKDVLIGQVIWSWTPFAKD